MTPISKTVELLADAYYVAAKAGLDMHNTATVLEQIRRVLLEPIDDFAKWRGIDDQIGRTEDPGLEAILVKFRGSWTELFCRGEIARLRELCANNPESGWKAWLTGWARGLAAVRFTEFCKPLCETPVKIPDACSAFHKRIQQATEHMRDGRRAEAFSVLLEVADHEDVPANLRATTYAYAAEIELNEFFRTTQAELMLQRANELAADATRVLCVWGTLALDRGEIPRAREYFQNAIQQDALSAEGYIGMADSFERQNDFTAAERWFQEGIRQRSGTPDTYLNLIHFYGRTEGFETHEPALAELRRRAIAVDPTVEYEADIAMGLAYQQAKRYEQAYYWFDRAMELAPNRPSAYTCKAYAYADEDKVDQARELFDSVIAETPDATDGYWGRALLEERANPRLALEFLDQGLARRPECEVMLRIRKSALYRQLGELDQAECELQAALKADPRNDDALQSLLEVGTQYTHVEGNLEASLRVYRWVRDLRGDEFEGSYQNLVGNLSFYQSDFAAAAAAYRRAIKAEGNDPILHSNLAAAIESLPTAERVAALDEAIAALQRASELDAKEPSYRGALERLERQQRMVARCGQKALEWMPVVPAIQVFVADDILPCILEADSSQLSPHFLNSLQEIRQQFFESTGVQVPSALFATLSGAGPGEYEIRFMGLLVGRDHVVPEQRFVVAPPGRKSSGGATADTGEPPAFVEGEWIANGDDRAASVDGAVWRPEEYIVHHFASILDDNIWRFVTHDAVIDWVKRSTASESQSIMAHPETWTALTAVVRRLVALHISIEPADRIIASFWSQHETGTTPAEIASDLAAKQGAE